MGISEPFSAPCLEVCSFVNKLAISEGSVFMRAFWDGSIRGAGVGDLSPGTYMINSHNDPYVFLLK